VSNTTIQAGSKVVITDADGVEHLTEALSGIEQKGHSFPIVWVNRPMRTGGFEPTPWPAEAVKVAPDA